MASAGIFTTVRYLDACSVNGTREKMPASSRTAAFHHHHASIRHISRQGITSTPHLSSTEVVPEQYVLVLSSSSSGWTPT